MASQPVIQTVPTPEQEARSGLLELRSQFERLLSVVDVVSFDLFDTLLQRKRLFTPKDLFYHLYSRSAHRLSLDGHDFVSARIRSEHIARIRARAAGRDETTLAGIYGEMARLLRCEAEELGDILREELLCEQEALSPIDTGTGFFNAARSQGKVVVIVTDTYLPADFVERIVKDNGYGDAIRVFASSAYGKSKLDGSLFDVVLHELHCAPNRLLHVGDNRLSDVAVPSSQGIRTMLLSTAAHRFKWAHRLNDAPSGSLTMSAMLCEIRHRWRPDDHEAGQDSILSRTAIHHLAPLYFGFAAWLVEQIKKGGYRRVYFASRDGAIIKRFFDLVAPAGGLHVESRYLYVSRATLYPSLSLTDPDMGKRVFSHNWDKMTVGEALNRMSLDRRDCDALLKSCGLPHDDVPIHRLTATKFARFLDGVWPHFAGRSEQHCQMLIEYLRQEQFLSQEPAAFVDIGWHASLQHCLTKLLEHLDIRKPLQGFYVGTFARPAGLRSRDVRGFLVEDDGPPSVSELVRAAPSLIELFHTAGHGSVLGYHRAGDRMLPVLQDNPVEQAQFKEIIEPIQERAYAFVAEHLKLASGASLSPPDPELLARLALRVVYEPTQAEAELFGTLKIATDMGGRMKSITGTAEWDLKEVTEDRLPDGTLPMWRAGFRSLNRRAHA